MKNINKHYVNELEKLKIPKDEKFDYLYQALELGSDADKMEETLQKAKRLEQNFAKLPEKKQKMILKKYPNPSFNQLDIEQPVKSDAKPVSKAQEKKKASKLDAMPKISPRKASPEQPKASEKAQVSEVMSDEDFLTSVAKEREQKKKNKNKGVAGSDFDQERIWLSNLLENAAKWYLKLIIPIAILAYFIFHPPLNFQAIPLYAILIIIILPAVFLGWNQINESEKKHLYLLPLYLTLGSLVLVAIWGLSIWDNGAQAKNQIGDIQDVAKSDFKKFQFSTQKTFVVNQTMATKIADKSMGADSLSSQFKLGKPTLQKLNYQGTKKLFWVFPLEFGTIFSQLSNGVVKNVIIVDANNPTANGIKLNTNSKGETYHIGVSDQGFLWQNLPRMVQLWYPTKYVTDFSLELDDELNPHYIVSVFQPTRGFAVNQVKGIIDINLMTNERTEYSVDKVPSWVDRVQPDAIIKEKVNNNGKYIHGIFNFSNKDKYKLTTGHAAGEENFIYLDDEPFFISGTTSNGADASLTGIMAMSLKTTKTYRIQLSGAIEASAKASAQGKTQNFNYAAANPAIIFAKGKWQYLVPLVDTEGLIKIFALVEIEHYQNVTLYNNIEEFVKDSTREDSVTVVDTGSGSGSASADILNGSDNGSSGSKEQEIDATVKELEGIIKKLNNLKNK